MLFCLHTIENTNKTEHVNVLRTSQTSSSVFFPPHLFLSPIHAISLNHSHAFTGHKSINNMFLVFCFFFPTSNKHVFFFKEHVLSSENKTRSLLEMDLTLSFKSLFGLKQKSQL